MLAVLQRQKANVGSRENYCTKGWISHLRTLGSHPPHLNCCRCFSSSFFPPKAAVYTSLVQQVLLLRRRPSIIVLFSGIPGIRINGRLLLIVFPPPPQKKKNSKKKSRNIFSGASSSRRRDIPPPLFFPHPKIRSGNSLARPQKQQKAEDTETQKKFFSLPYSGKWPFLPCKTVPLPSHPLSELRRLHECPFFPHCQTKSLPQNANRATPDKKTLLLAQVVSSCNSSSREMSCQRHTRIDYKTAI